jgi:hypothetical protein
MPDYRSTRIVIVGRLDERTAKALMRALCMVVSYVLANEFSQVRLTQRDDAVEAFLFDRAYKAFDECVQVWASSRQANRLHTGVPEHVADIGSKDRVAIHDQVGLA